MSRESKNSEKTWILSDLTYKKKQITYFSAKHYILVVL